MGAVAVSKLLVTQVQKYKKVSAVVSSLTPTEINRPKSTDYYAETKSYVTPKESVSSKTGSRPNARVTLLCPQSKPQKLGDGRDKEESAKDRETDERLTTRLK